MIYNKNKIFRCAWLICKNEKIEFREALKLTWKKERQKFYYKENKNMINKMAYKYYKINSFIDYKELICEANSIFIKCFNRYSFKKNFKGYLYNYLNSYLNKYVKKLNRQKALSFKESAVDKNNNYKFSDLILSVNDEIKEMIETVIKAPAELLEIGHTNKITKDKLYKYYKKYKGWNHSKIINTFDKIRGEL